MARTENDTWDLASSVGATATAVACQRAMASQGPDPLLDDPWADPLVRAEASTLSSSYRHRDRASTTDPVLSRRTVNEQITVRTRFFDDFFLQATGSGIGQAVILASGLDTRAYRLPWPAGTVVYEIDQPEVIEFKTRDAGRPGCRAQRAAPHRRDRSARRLALGSDHGRFRHRASTAWSAEGLLVYLPPDAQDRLFDNIAALSAPGSRIATEHMDMRNIPIRTGRRGSPSDLGASAPTSTSPSCSTPAIATPPPNISPGTGWRVDIRTTEQAFAAHGFQVPKTSSPRWAATPATCRRRWPSSACRPARRRSDR